jgi:hypothetical protein
MSSWESDLLLGIAALLDGQGVGTFRGDGSAYAAGETAIVFGELPTGPDRAIGLALYNGGADDVAQNVSRPRLQLMFRGAPGLPLDAGDIASAAFLVLHGAEHRDYGTAHLIQALRQSTVPLGVDDNRRTMRSDNYALDVNTPHTA